MPEKMALKITIGKKARRWLEVDRRGFPGSVLSKHY